MRVSEIATAHPVSVLTTTSTEDAARFMADLVIGDVIVSDEHTGSVLGMLTDRDLAVHIVAQGLDAAGTSVGTVYTPNAVTIGAEAAVSDVVDLMTSNGLHRIPVVDSDGRAVGLISVEDLSTCEDVSDDQLRAVMKSIANKYRERRVLGRE